MPRNTNIGILEKWWVLRHMNPKAIDQQLKVLNEQRVLDGQQELTYLIPRQFTTEAEPNKTMGAEYEKSVQMNNNLRTSLYHYLFVKATDVDILQLVGSEWNRSLTNRLRLCRSKMGEPLWASAKDMDQFIELMLRYREMFNVVPGDFKLEKGDVVKVKMDAFDGYEFMVTQFRGHGRGAELTLELPLFNGKFRLRTENVYVEQEKLPLQVRELLSPEFVSQMETGLIEVIRHRYGRRKSDKTVYDSDMINLNNFHYLNYMALSDSLEHRHIRVLLLLCAALRKDRGTVEALLPVVMGYLDQRDTDEEAFIMSVLFIATQDADWRTAAKQYGQTHTALSEPLSQLLPLIKNIHFRNNQVRITRRLASKQSRRIADTLVHIRACDPAALSPEAISAICDILSLPAYDTEGGRTLLAIFKAQQLPTSEGEKPWGLALQATKDQTGELSSEMGPWMDSEPTLQTLMQSRSRILHQPHPSVDALASYYRILVRLYPDRTTSDAADLYAEFQKILLSAYTKASLFSTSWWQLKAILEHCHNFSK